MAINTYGLTSGQKLLAAEAYFKNEGFYERYQQFKNILNDNFSNQDCISLGDIYAGKINDVLYRVALSCKYGDLDVTKLAIPEVEIIDGKLIGTVNYPSYTQFEIKATNLKTKDYPLITMEINNKNIISLFVLTEKDSKLLVENKVFTLNQCDDNLKFRIKNADEFEMYDLYIEISSMWTKENLAERLVTFPLSKEETEKYLLNYLNY